MNPVLYAISQIDRQIGHQNRPTGMNYNCSNANLSAPGPGAEIPYGPEDDPEFGGWCHAESSICVHDGEHLILWPAFALVEHQASVITGLRIT
jgi:hypothetical protein